MKYAPTSANTIDVQVHHVTIEPAVHESTCIQRNRPSSDGNNEAACVTFCSARRRTQKEGKYPM